MKSTVVLLVCLLLGQSAIAAETYTQRWLAFETTLLHKEKTFQNAPALDARYGSYQRVDYPSAGMSLAALLDTRHLDPAEPRAAVVYLHGGFGLSPRELAVADMFADAGLVVMVPTWRGENQNPGYFECFLGEVADARAAVQWLASQPGVDPERIYVFGWSVGGGIALNLSLLDDIPVRLSGSSAGVYDRELITAWATEDDYIVFPYDYRDETENYFRLPIYHLQDMARDHYTYVGAEDDYAVVAALYESLYPQANTRLTLIEVAGGHQESLPAAVAAFLQVIAGDMPE
jgi:dipeptidyl aminopeptidase/acylaminoacyl peptidase